MLKNKKIIELRNVGFINKGAELMLYAIIDKINKLYPNADYAMSPSVSKGNSPYQKRAKLGFLQKTNLYRYGFQFGSLAKFIPEKIREMYGLVLNSEIDIVLDAAGFNYSDQWGNSSCVELAKSCKVWKKNGTRVILLPQAFGPFESVKNKKAMTQVIELADLVFARDEQSYNYLTEIFGPKSNLKLSPDFTNLIAGICPKDFDSERNKFCIIPNYRMIDKTSEQNSNLYIPLMIEVVNYLFTNKQKPFILVHEGKNDLLLAKTIRDSVSSEIQIIQESNPLKIKGIIGCSRGVVGSRFHGLVSSLSQAVPSLATGWSHKYKMLFDDYKFPEGLLDVNISKSDLHRKLDILINEDSRESLISNLKSSSVKLKQQSEKMWNLVLEKLL